MQRLIIKKFGPIEDLDINLNEFILLVGPQASGKSTIAKTIFFFKSIRDDIVLFLSEYIKNSTQSKVTLLSIKKIISRKFLDYFGPSAPLQGMELKFYYAEDCWIKITLEETHSYVTPDFSENISDELKSIIKQTQLFCQTNNPSLILSSTDLIRHSTMMDTYIEILTKRIKEIFFEDHELIYIPAGRSLLATLSDQLQLIETRQLDCLMKLFIQKIVRLRPMFSRSIQDLIKEKMVLSELGKGCIDFSRVRTAEKIINSILKGRYQYDGNGEKLYIDKYKYIKLNFASSGQQESLWILLLIFIIILEQQNIFIVIEEPEAHLYPTAQKSISTLIALLANIQKSQVIITTHSPYIIASINNLILAEKVARKYPEDIQKKINKNSWIKREKVYAAMIKDGKASEIIDPDFDIIQQEVIDDISHQINAEFDFLYSYECE